MRKSFISIAMFSILCICIGGCGGSSGDDSSEQTPIESDVRMPEGVAISENEVENFPSTQIHADRDTYVTYLEPIGTLEELNLTGEIGFDQFSYVYEIPINHTICWEDDDPGAAHVLKVLDNLGAEVLSVQANAGCVTQLVQPGIYKARVEHDNLTDITFPVFIVPQFLPTASNQIETQNYFTSSIESLVSSLAPVATSHAQVETLELTTVIYTNKCTFCSLEGINLRAQDLSGANLEGSNLRGAILETATFSSANFMGSSLLSSDIRRTNFIGADLRAADLSLSEVDDCTNFLDADMTSAVWFDGCSCLDSECSNCGEIPMRPDPLGLIGLDECARVQGPGFEGPGDGPIIAPPEVPSDIPILSGD